MQLLLATTNAGKIRELKELLGTNYQILSLKDFPAIPPAVENGTTFAENALIKARLAAAHSHIWTLADDSGLAVDYLNGAPGIYSARFAGENATDAENNAKLLALLADVPYEKRTARFICAIALVSPDGEEYTFRGSSDGHLLTAALGTDGFGYDPLFYSDELGVTFAQASSVQKNTVSHRSRALAKACAFLQTQK